MKRISVYCDGTYWNGHVGLPLGIGVAVWIDGAFNYENSLSKRYEPINVIQYTSNLAEFVAMWNGLKIVNRLRKDEKYKDYSFEIFSDSQFAVDYLSYYDHAAEIFEFEEKELRLLRKEISISWIPREFNKEADVLSRHSLGKKAKYSKFVLEGLFRKEERYDRT